MMRKRLVPDHAMVLAAGQALRMRPLTEHTPKALIEVGGRTMLDRVLDHLDAAHVPHRVVNAHWKAEQIAAHLGNMANIAISHEDTLLDTGGGVAFALPLLGDKPFYACNADVVWRDGPEPALARMAAAWDDGAMDALLLLQPVKAAIGYEGPGDFGMGADGRLMRRPRDKTAPYVFTGVQLLHPRLFEAAPAGPFSLNLLYDRAQKNGRLFGIEHDGVWLHIGTPAQLESAEAYFASAEG